VPTKEQNNLMIGAFVFLVILITMPAFPYNLVVLATIWIGGHFWYKGRTPHDGEG
jgi:hypothetical protein